ncbi:hypothetical protein VCUG_01600 [Vavraia culicis subsp. floridensis]|uniref:Uncharacterized protein n=1 Tax=Vavraia culicis (isolate floridensis) TaxID=948595 RepID=L2GU92_VAVCU|nr:uncharacterized protein VCUG_01600 [Vavraia culicis subsp. floridensis]ELA46902.1 hypothetical protein VCUG_01600 [Vavraia culicis subsp. floridensis]
MSVRTFADDLVKKFVINDNSDDTDDSEKQNEVLQINLVPGTLYMNMSGIIGKYGNHSRLESFYVVLKNKDGIVGAEEVKREYGKAFDVFFKLRIEDSCEFKLILYLKYKNMTFDHLQSGSIKAFEKNLKRYGECTIDCDKDDIKKWHNGVHFVDYALKRHSEPNIIKRFLELFEPDPPEIYGLKAHMSYIAFEEQRAIQARTINSLSDLKEWLRFRQNTYKKFFHGYINLKGHGLEHCTHLWKRRYIEWNGYKIRIFNVYTNEKIGTVDVSNASVQCVDVEPKNFLKDNLMRINVESGYMEAHFDSVKSYERCLSAAKFVFGRVHRLKNW